MTAVKRCPRCGQVKPASEFYRRQRTRLSSYCRACQKAAARAARRRRRQDPSSPPAAWSRREAGHPGPLHQHPPRLAGGRPTEGRPMTAAFLDFLGWDQLTVGKQVAAVSGACLGLAAWLLARTLFGGRRQR
jgi:hypothetical protein